jgi:hypothetical protein
VVNGTALTYTVPAVNDGKLRTYSLERTGTVVNLILDGVTYFDATAAAGSFILDAIGRDSVGNYFDGVIANVKFTDLDTPSTLTFALDETTANIELPAENVFGSEEIINGDFSNGTTDWQEPRGATTLSIESGNLRSTSDGTGTFGVAQELTGLTIGQSFILSMPIDIGNISTPTTFEIRVAENLALGAAVQAIASSISVSDTYTGTFIATATTMFVGVLVAGHSSGEFFELEPNTSVKSVTNAVTYTNIPTGAPDRELFALVGANWIEGELWDNTPTLGSQWTDNGGGSYSYAGDGAFNDMSEELMDTGNVYQVSFDVQSISGLMKVFSGSVTEAYSSTGIKSFIMIAGSDFLAWTRNSGVASTTMDAISVKRILEAP